MRWFKHLSHASDDETLSRILDLLGPFGYGVYFLILEIISRQMKKGDSECKTTYSLARWQHYLSIYHSKKLIDTLDILHENGLIYVVSQCDLVTISCPNLLKYRDEYNKKSGVCLKKAPLDTDTDTEAETHTDTEAKTETEEKEKAFVEQARPRSESAQDICSVFDHWKSMMYHPGAKLDEKRKRLIRAALKMGYTVGEICDAVTGCNLTPHNMGHNEQGQRYDGLHIILRSADQIDRFIANSKNPPRALSKADRKTQQNINAAQEWLADKLAIEGEIDEKS
jgi:hypothetical protein